MASPDLSRSPESLAAGTLHRTLENGAQLVVRRHETPASVVAIQLWVARGTAAETNAEHGCAHLLEHMVFKPCAPPGFEADMDLATAVEDLGGDCNAFTTHDETVYHCVVPARRWREALDAIAGPVLHPRLDAAELEREREVVIEEVLQSADDPAQRIGDAVMTSLYGEHAYGRPVLGLRDEVAAHSASVLRRFWRRNYCGRSVALVVVGDLRPSEVARHAKRWLSRLPAGRRRRVPTPTGPASTRSSVLRMDVHESQCVAAWQAPAAPHNDAIALELAALALGHGDAGWLTKDLQRRDGLITDGHAALYNGAYASTFWVQLQTGVDGSAEALRGLGRLVHGLCERPLERATFERARAVLASDRVYRLETCSGLAHVLGYYATVFGSLEVDARYHEGLRELTPEKVRDACARWLRVPGAVAAVSTTKAALTGRALVQALSGARGRKAARMKKYRQGVWSCVLPSGLRVQVQPSDTLPMTAGWWVWRGGLRNEAPRDAGASHLIGRLLTRGTATRSADELAADVEGRAAVLDGFSGRNSLGLHFECLAADALPMLERLVDCATAPSFGESEFAEERRVVLHELDAEADDLAQQALRAAVAGLYGKHPYGRSVRGTAESVRRLSAARLRQLFGKDYPAGAACLSVAGAADPETVAQHLEALVGGLPAAASKLRRAGLRWPAKPRRVQLLREREQAHLAMAFPGLPLGHPDAEVLEVLLAVLGGQAGRLFSALRERDGLVYHCAASGTEGLDAGHVVVYAGTGQDKFARAEAAVLGELAAVRDAPVTRRELARAKATLEGQHEMASQRRSRTASLLGFAQAYGLGPGYYDDYVRRVRKVSAADVRRVAAMVFDARRVSVASVRAPGAAEAGARHHPR